MVSETDRQANEPPLTDREQRACIALVESQITAQRALKDNERLRIMLRSVIQNLKRTTDRHDGGEPGPLCGTLGRKVAHFLGIGSTRAHEVCQEFGEDPNFVNPFE